MNESSMFLPTVDARLPMEYLEDALTRFREVDRLVEDPEHRAGRRITVTAIGARAHDALASHELCSAFQSFDLALDRSPPRSNSGELFGVCDWDLALVLSPWKRELVRYCDRLTPTARNLGAVDTVIGTKVGWIGFNTNVFAITSALRGLIDPTRPVSALIIGTGATARATLCALRTSYPDARVSLLGRSAEKARAVVDEIGFGAAIDAVPSERFDVLINATAVGERDDAARLAHDLSPAMVPGSHFFDLNVRLSALQQQAVARGLVTVSGVGVQQIVHFLRAYISARVRPAALELSSVGQTSASH